MVKKSINQALIDAGIVTESQLLECHNQAVNTGKSLEQCFIESHAVSAQDIAKVYAKYASLLKDWQMIFGVGDMNKIGDMDE